MNEIMPGSSPLARGLPGAVRDQWQRFRIIPARAGFTRGRVASRRRGRDHPRSRGVYRTGVGRSNRASGSSPLARGLPPFGCRTCRATGIIPARAGFTQKAREAQERAEDHPRSRGVYRPDLATIGARLGSSPLARGLQAFPCGGSAGSGIIPARAGFTATSNGTWKRLADHPRSRGVYENGWKSDYDFNGSSPLARGLLGGCRLFPGGVRIIPARAGFTS